MVSTALRQSVQFVRCAIGDVSVGFVMDHVDGVERADSVRPSERTDIVGTLDTPAGKRPVYRLADVVGVEHRQRSGVGQVVLLTTPSGAFGVLADRVSSVYRLPHTAVRECPLGFGLRERTLYAGVALHADGPILFVAPDAIQPSEDVSLPWLTGGDTTTVQEFPPASDRLLVFDIVPDPQRGGRPVGFGIPSGWVSEVADVGHVTPVPGAASHLHGVSARRGSPVAVLDLGAWLGVRPPVDRVNRVVEVQTSRGRIAFSTGSGVRLVDRATPSVPIRRAPFADTHRLAGGVDFDNVTVLIPNLCELG